MEQMRNCVVSYLDLVGMKDLLADPTRRQRAIDAMEALDRMCHGHSTYVQQIDHIYCWNDSTLFLSYLDMPIQRNMNDLVAEVSRLKQAIDTECGAGSFVVMVKGKSFVPNGMQFRAPMHHGAEPDPVYHYIRASSMAFANCETILSQFKRDHHDWYIDQRVRDGMSGSVQAMLMERGEFHAFPRMTTRKVFTADGYLHEQGA